MTDWKRFVRPEYHEDEAALSALRRALNRGEYRSASSSGMYGFYNGKGVVEQIAMPYDGRHGKDDPIRAYFTGQKLSKTSIREVEEYYAKTKPVTGSYGLREIPGTIGDLVEGRVRVNARSVHWRIECLLLPLVWQYRAPSYNKAPEVSVETMEAALADAENVAYVVEDVWLWEGSYPPRKMAWVTLGSECQGYVAKHRLGLAQNDAEVEAIWDLWESCKHRARQDTAWLKRQADG